MKNCKLAALYGHLFHDLKWNHETNKNENADKPSIVYTFLHKKSYSSPGRIAFFRMIFYIKCFLSLSAITALSASTTSRNCGLSNNC